MQEFKFLSMNLEKYLLDRITHLKTSESYYWIRATDGSCDYALSKIYMDTSKEFAARRQELELIQKEISNGHSVPQGDEP